jgi:hypothetical protein
MSIPILKVNGDVTVPSEHDKVLSYIELQERLVTLQERRMALEERCWALFEKRLSLSGRKI